MNETFATKQEAIEAGFRPINPAQDRDISQGNWRGYDWMSAEGDISVSVLITEGQGCVIPMYPPRPVDFVPHKPLSPDQVEALDADGYRAWLREASRAEVAAHKDFMGW